MEKKETSNVGYSNMIYNTENEKDDQHRFHKKNKSDPGVHERWTVLQSVNIEHKSYQKMISSNSMFRHFHQYACYIIVLLVQGTGEDHHSGENGIASISSQAGIILAIIIGCYDKV